MSSDQPFPTITSTLDMDVEASSRVVCSEWYNPSTYAYSDPFMTSYPSSTIGHQTWPHFVQTPLPDINMNVFGIQDTASQQYPPQMTDSRRSRRSPSHLGLNADSMLWPPSGLGIQYTPPSTANIPTPPVSSTFPSMAYAASTGIPTPPVSSTFPPRSFTISAGGPTPPVSSTFPPLAFTAAAGVPTPPVSSTFTPIPFKTYPKDDIYHTSSPDIRRSQSGRPYTSIAPNPSPVLEKRKRDDDDEAAVNEVSTSKRRKRTPSAASAVLSDEDKLLLQLKEDEQLPWKELITRFKTETNKTHTVASLQMRYKRLRDKHRVWEDVDVEALRKAHEYWETSKWDIISAKMLEFGVSEKWPSRNCGRKWQELVAVPSIVTHSHFNTPTSASQHSSPTEGAMHFNWMSLSS